MEQQFKQLQSQGNNNQENLTEWLKQAKLVDNTPAEQSKLKALFQSVPEPKNIAFGVFKQIVTKLAEDHKKKFQDYAVQLAKNEISKIKFGGGGGGGGGPSTSVQKTDDVASLASTAYSGTGTEGSHYTTASQATKDSHV